MVGVAQQQDDYKTDRIILVANSVAFAVSLRFPPPGDGGYMQRDVFNHNQWEM